MNFFQKYFKNIELGINLLIVHKKNEQPHNKFNNPNIFISVMFNEIFSKKQKIQNNIWHRNGFYQHRTNNKKYNQ